MIKLEAAHIEEVRGIRKLDIVFDKATFAISGPNGSGKSGVIDAIEFGLTGEIGRLTGRGTKGLSVSQHGPHVDKVDFPDAAYVELKVFIPTLGKRATITRKLKAPGKPIIVPADPDVQAAALARLDCREVRRRSYAAVEVGHQSPRHRSGGCRGDRHRGAGSRDGPGCGRADL